MKSLLFAIAVTVAVLYVPGFFFLRSIRFDRLSAIIFAPIVAFFICAIVPIIYYPLGISCTPLTVGLVLLAVGFMPFVVVRLIRKWPDSAYDLVQLSKIRIGSYVMTFEWLACALYVAIGLFACWFVFVSSLPGASAFVGQWDNQFHLNAIRSFLDSGQWSALHVSSYATSPDSAIPYASHVQRYPTGWHDVVALVCATTGREVTVCVNAVNIALAGIMYPSAMFMLVKSLFQDDRLVVVSGAGVASAFTAFPWGMFAKGPIYPNFCGFVAMLLFIAFVVAFVERRLFRNMPVQFAALFVVFLVAIVLAHPNALFASFIFLAAYASHAIWTTVRSSSRWSLQKRTRIAALSSVAVLFAASVVLVICNHAPFLQDVVQYDVKPRFDAFSAIKSLALLNLGRIASVFTAPEYALALIAGYGIVSCLLKHRFWLLLPIAYMAFGFVLTCSVDAPITKLVAGFWYNSPLRMAACYELFLAPIAACGLADIARIPSWVRARMSDERNGLHRDKSVSSSFASKVLIVAIAIVVIFVPSMPLPGDSMLRFGIGQQQRLIQRNYATGKKAVYSKGERAFVKKALSVIPENAVVLNQPRDGTIFAYALEGLNTYYRRIPLKKETGASRLIRTKLVDYSTDSDVRNAVNSIGAEYLILLDQGAEGGVGRWHMNGYERSKWAGIDAIADDTPGFSVMLAQGDMRLYRIG